MSTSTMRKREGWRHWFTGLSREETLAGFLFASPFIIGFLVFVAFPMIYSILIMFQKWDLISPAKFVGLDNIIKMLSDPKVNKSLGSIPPTTPLSLCPSNWSSPSPWPCF